MSRKNNSPQPQPAAILAESPAAPDNVTSIKGAGLRKSIFDSSGPVLKPLSDAARDKIAVMGDARQKLAEAFDLFKSGSDKEKEAVEVASNAALRLYQARSTGIVSPEEVSAALGDVFGYKPKTDGTPGKTPMGQGEAIRKRVVRAAQAREYVDNGDGGRFFNGLPEADVSAILAAMETGKLGFWAAYEAFSALKRDHMTRVSPAFNQKHIEGLVDTLSEEGAADNFRNNSGLVIAYAALMDILRIIGEEVASEETEVETEAA